MAPGIEEGYLAVIVVYLILAYVLGYAARLAVGDMRVSYPIEYRGLAVVNVAHYYYYGAALFQRFGSVLFVGDKAVFYRNDNFLLYLSAQLFRNERSGVEVDSFVEGSHYAQTHQLLDDLGSCYLQAGSQLGNNDLVRDLHLELLLSCTLKLQTLDNIPIGVIKVFPGIQFSLFEAIMTEKLRGIVIETFGAGNIPGDGNALLPIIRKAFQNGTVLTVCWQCPQGAVSLGTYETSSALKKAGAVSGLDMTTEAAVAKLYYLFSCGYDKEKIKQAMEEDLRGEISVS